MANRIIPVHKDDQEAISALGKADEAEIILAADELLEWMQDGNWPVSLPIGEILTRHIDKIAYKIVGIMQGNDSAWKYCCIRFLLMNLTVAQVLNIIITELKRIALHLTINDTAELAAEAAEEMLSGSY